MKAENGTETREGEGARAQESVRVRVRVRACTAWQAACREYEGSAGCGEDVHVIVPAFDVGERAHIREHLRSRAIGKILSGAR